MPTWGEILAELAASAEQNNGQADFDGIRRKYLKGMFDVTGRPVILYSTDWLQKGGPATAINLEDMQGMMEACKGLPGPNLDIILHSPGGSAEATASIVGYLRKKYNHIRVFIPLAAMSAATMWALSADEIWMGKHSQLGPIDPQLVMGNMQHPARAIIQQFERAKKECKDDPSVLSAWLPLLQQYGPSLLVQCENAEKLAQRLVREWLSEYMFKDMKTGAKPLARKVARWFSDYSKHNSHSLGIDRDQAKDRGLRVQDLEMDQPLQDAVLSVHHATIHTFSGSAAKIIENHLGKAFVKHVGIQQVQIPIIQQ